MNDIKMPKINFIPLKQCITDDEGNFKDKSNR